MIQITDKSQCCGCTACASICTHNAITMKPDTMGFLYPVVDLSKCINCGLCDKVCTFNDDYDKSLNLQNPKAYAARHKNLSELRYSRSGAAFIAISDEIIRNGGVVYGAGYTDHFRVVHKRATTKEQRDEFKGSKYVQSDLTGIFRQVKKDLQNDCTVLFSGTPCQTAALNKFVGIKLRKKLILVDIICHSVPSPSIWQDYLTYIEKKYKSKIIKLEFRDKSIGWHQEHLESFTLENGKQVKDSLLRIFFYRGLGTRLSCSDCKFCNLQRPSDITIGDFWGYERSVPEMNLDNKGISLIICNTQKGLNLIEKLNDIQKKEVGIDKIIQPNLQYPSPIDPRWEEFNIDYKKYGFIYIGKKYGNIGLRFKIKHIIRRIKSKLLSNL